MWIASTLYLFFYFFLNTLSYSFLSLDRYFSFIFLVNWLKNNTYTRTVENVQVRAGRVQIGGLTRVVARVVEYRVVDGQRGHHRVGVQPLATNHFCALAVVQHPFVVLVPEYIVRVSDALPYHALEANRATLHHVYIRLAHDLDLWHCEIVYRSVSQQVDNPLQFWEWDWYERGRGLEVRLGQGNWQLAASFIANVMTDKERHN